MRPELAHPACRGVIFDLDGTLVDTLDDIRRTVNIALDVLEDPSRTREEVRKMVGDGVEVLCRRALTRPTPERIARMTALMKSSYREKPIDTATPYPGIMDMLEDLRTLGITLSVLTNKPQEMADVIISLLFPGIPFRAVLGRRKELPPKPDPSGAFRIAELVDLPPSQWLYVGDSEVDIRTARAAGISMAAVTWGFRTLEELKGAGASLLMTHPSEIAAFVSAMNAGNP